VRIDGDEVRTEEKLTNSKQKSVTQKSKTADCGQWIKAENESKIGAESDSGKDGVGRLGGGAPKELMDRIKSRL